MEEKPPIEPVLRALAAKARRDLDDHPTPEELVAYRAGELTAEDEEKIRDHLALCRDCSQLLLDLKEFEEDEPEEESGLSDIQVEAAWRRLRPRLEERKVLTSRRRWFASPQVAYGLAAGLFLCTVGLSVWGVSLKQRIERLSGPQIMQSVDLRSDGDTTRSAAGAENTVQPGGEQFALFMRVWEPVFSEYEAVIRRAEQKGEPLVLRGLPRNQDDNLGITLPRSMFPPGSYQLELYGRSGESRQPVTTYLFHVLPERNGRPKR